MLSKQTLILVSALLVVTPFVWGQNIGNPDFEEFVECPEYLGQINFAPPWEEVIPSADYYNCDLNADVVYPTPTGASSGTGLVSVGTYGNLSGAAEAIGQLLPIPFETGTEYSFSIDLKKAEESSWGYVCTGICFYGFTTPPPTWFSFIHVSSLEGAELLGCTETVSSTEWTTDTISFTAQDDYTYLAVTPGIAPECYQIIFIDNIQQLTTVPVEEEEEDEEEDTSENEGEGDPEPTLSVIAPTHICTGSSVELLAEFSGGEVEWNKGSTNPSITINQGGLYTATVTSAGGTVVTETVFVTEISPPFISVSGGQYCEGKEAIVTAFADADSIYWPGYSSTGELITNQSGLYTVLASNQCGTESSTVAVEFEDCDCEVFVPNAFTPNGDGINDLFRPQSACDFGFYQLKILNRWGEEVFQSDDPTKAWDGAGAMNSDFFGMNSLYLYKLVFSNQNKPGDGRTELNGQVLLIR